jgi:hypothetical protein
MDFHPGMCKLIHGRRGIRTHEPDVACEARGGYSQWRRALVAALPQHIAKRSLGTQLSIAQSFDTSLHGTCRSRISPRAVRVSLSQIDSPLSAG